MDGIELMAGAMQAMRTRLDVAALNLANASTDGFQRRVASTRLGAGGLTTGTRTDASQGPLRATGRPFDLAVSGEGGFAVRARDGSSAIVRAGSFERDARGRLRDRAGNVLLGEHGPLVAGPGARIDARGVVREGDRVVARLRRHGDVELHAGFLAGSNVQSIHEMVDVLGAQRAFETAQKVLSALDDVRAKAAAEVARVQA